MEGSDGEPTSSPEGGRGLRAWCGEVTAKGRGQHYLGRHHKGGAVGGVVGEGGWGWEAGTRW